MGQGLARPVPPDLISWDIYLFNWDMPQFSRSASLTGFADLARSLGLDPWRLAQAADVPRAALTDPDLKIRASTVGRLLSLAAERAGADDFGLRLAETRRFSNMGAVALIARDQPSLRKALEVMAQYQWMQSEGVSLLLEESGDVAIASLGLTRRAGEDARQPVELSLGVLCRNIRALMGEDWRPEAVLFRHGKPKRMDVHRRVFGIAPLFGQDTDGLVIPRKELDRPLPAADPVLARHAQRYIDQLAGSRGRTTRELVRELIVLLLPTGQCTADRVARHIGVDRRTLHRRLASESTGFAALLEDTRAELVQSLMADKKRPLSAIAEMAGLSGASAFSHWFRKRFGTSPRAWRMGRE
jgi:AraC-like DNA-binding protein